MKEIPQFKKEIKQELPKKKKGTFLKSVAVVVGSMLVSMGIQSNAVAKPSNDIKNLNSKESIEKVDYLYSASKSGDIMQQVAHYSHYSHSSHQSHYSHSSHSSHYSHYSSSW